ncbi:MAG: low-specificity L-threonine aldolase [Clostridiales bacterium]|jgi:threonine aldolase|nr:low-specificity L-threonine aldolase [Clostridiales bacterium]
MKYIDLRSDTVTQPTQEMRRAMFEAEVGDDVYSDDPTVNRLEALAADMLGKEAAIFVTSGLMGNQTCIMAHTRYGDEIIVGKDSHIAHYESGAAARLSGVSYALVQNPDTFLYADDIKRLYRPKDMHFPRTGLVCLENALCNGDVAPLTALNEACDAAHALGVPVHMDGARIFNAALALGCAAKDIASKCDSVTFCLSKGLCAPVGAVVCGSKAFIERVRFMRKMVGGGLRQAGVLAAPGIVALEVMTKRLHEDHANAKYLGEELNKLPGVSADMNRVKINMVFWRTENPAFTSDGFVDFMFHKGIKVSGILTDAYRFVTHNDVTRERIDKALAAMRAYIATLSPRKNM